ncbi:ankyrin repeat domain-containing protein [Pelagerythrobacter sp.]|uniref:ankyrin repeat domain-containing protein n=1 Tax=Pelagerythrobacter sp. TaxID=2800702 RepID=UPI0035B0FD94
MARAAMRMAIAIGLAAAAMPAAAQMKSEGYEFLEAVRDRDGTVATDALRQPGSVVVNSRDQTTGETGLHIVAKRRDAVWIKFLTQNGANPNIADKNGVTPLAIASNLGFVEGVEALLEAGARVDEPSATGETPLIAAIHRRDAAMVRMLLANGANPDRTDNSGRSARDYAELRGPGNRMLAEIAEAEAAGDGGVAQKTYGPEI